MHTSHVDHFTRRSAASILSSLLLGAALTAPGCGGGKSGKPEQSPADQFCGSLSEYVNACAAAATPCDQAMIEDCTSVVGLVSDGFLRTASDCIQGGGSPFSCLAGAIQGLAPSAAHEAFVAQFCDECAFGIGGCEDVLLGRSEGPPELAAASVLVLPLGDSLVDALREECASGLGCLATFPNCAQKVLAQQVIPENTLQCLLDSFSGKAPEAPSVPEDSASACGLSGGEATMGGPGWSTAGTAGESESEATSAGETNAGTDNTGTSGEPGTTQGETTGTTTSNTTGTTDEDVSTSGSTTTGDNPDMGSMTDTDGWDQLCAGPFSEHNECGVGGPLPEPCTWCTGLVCNYIDAFCCDSQWDDMCQAHANERCSMSCGAGTQLCAHSPCEAGAALTRSCSDCVLAVCDSKPSCCDVAWDNECASMASACGIC